MVTTRRSAEQMTMDYEEPTGNVALLERNPKPVAQRAPAPEKPAINDASEMDAERAKRMQNLDRILNYDRYSDLYASEAVIDAPAPSPAQPVAEEPIAEKAQAISVSDDDLRPTATTMQFGDGEGEKLLKDMKTEEKEESRYRLNGKGKLVVVLYALAVAVILTLIVLNTGVLMSLSDTRDVLTARLDDVRTEYANQLDNLEYLSSEEYISSQAEQLGMIK